MELSDEKKKEYIKRLLLSRMRLLNNHGFFGLLLMHMIFAMTDTQTETACTDGIRISFNPKFLESLSDRELDFVLMHEILHVVLQHCLREGGRQPERFNIACDIVVNSIILQENKMDPQSITLKQWGESMHIAPDGKEGYAYTAEQVYEMLPNVPGNPLKGCGSGNGNGNGSGSGNGNGNGSGNGNEDGNEDEDETGNDDGNKDGNEDGDGNGSGSGNGTGNGSAAGGGTGNGNRCGGKGKGKSSLGRAMKKQRKAANQVSWDDHAQWGMLEDDDTLRDVWVKQLDEACEAIKIRDPSNTRGLLPAFAQRLLDQLKDSQTDWREILNDFVQMEINDYSFSPPDRRFQESPFFLPDFNELGESDKVSDILFMIDTSGSISDEMMTAAYSEVKGAIDQFDGNLKGWLGFFDAAIIEPVPFETVDEFLAIRPAGGGGTDFQIIFEYVHKYMEDNPPACIIILTDGYAPFPQEHLAKGIPVLWLINNEAVDPPWGKVARIKA